MQSNPVLSGFKLPIDGFAFNPNNADSDMLAFVSSAIGGNVWNGNISLIQKSANINLEKDTEECGNTGVTWFGKDNILVSTDEGNIQLLSTSTLDSIAEFEGHHNIASCTLEMNPGKNFVSGGWDHRIFLWEAAKPNAALVNFAGHEAEINDLARIDDNIFVSGSRDGSSKFWDIRTAPKASAAITTIQVDSKEAIFSIAAAHSNDKLALGTEGGIIFLYDQRNPKAPLKKQAIHARTVRCLSFSPDGSLLASAGDEGVIAVLSSELEKRFSASAHTDHITDLKWKKQGVLLSSSWDKSILEHKF